MRYFIFLILSTMFWSCIQNSRAHSIENFTVKTYSIAVDTNVWEVLFFNKHYYCLMGNHRFICLDNKFELDSLINNSINQQYFDYSFISGDSLIAGIYGPKLTTKDYFLNSELKWLPVATSHKPANLFEDEKFLVSSCCAGEFGGSVFFMEKKSNRVYSCPSTCATSINKLGESYYVTSTLAHLGFYTQVIKIEDPTKLFELTEDSLINYCNWWAQSVTNSDDIAGMKRFEIGTQTILEKRDIFTIASFVSNGQLYHINADREKTFISKIQGDSLILVDSIFNKKLWTFEPICRRYGKMQLCSFNDVEASGFLTINSDTISIITFDIKKDK